MSDMARRAIKALPRLSGSTSPAPPDEPPSPRLVVEVRAPAAVLRNCGPDTWRVLADGLRGYCRDLRVDAVVETTAAVDRSDQVSVSLNGRPLALAASDDVTRASAPGVELCHIALRGMAHRLPLLLGDGAADWARQLLALGCALPPADTSPRTSDLDAEDLFRRGAPREIFLEVSPDTMRRTGDARAVPRLREREFEKRGVRYPDIRLQLADTATDTLTLRLNDVTLPPLPLPPDADWPDAVGAVGDELAARRHWFVRSDQVERTLTDDFGFLVPELVSATLRAFTVEEVTACFRELVWSGRRIRNVPRILWLMLEEGDTHATTDRLRLSESPLTPRGRHQPGSSLDPVVLAARVRKMAAEESWRLGNYRFPQRSVRLERGLEERLLGSTGDAVATTEWDIVRTLAAAPEAERIVTHTIEAIRGVREAAAPLARRLRVMASQELPPDVDVESFTTLAAPARSRLSSQRVPHRTSPDASRRS